MESLFVKSFQKKDAEGANLTSTQIVKIDGGSQNAEYHDVVFAKFDKVFNIYKNGFFSHEILNTTQFTNTNNDYIDVTYTLRKPSGASIASADYNSNESLTWNLQASYNALTVSYTHLRAHET